MEFADAVRARRMVRRFDPARPVPRAAITALLDLATRAPSAGFSQGWHFLVLDESSDRERFWSATALDRPEDAWLAGMRTAPALILPMADRAAYLRRYAEPDKAGSTAATPADGSADGSTADPAGTDPAGTDRGAADRGVSEQWPVPYWDLDTAMAAMIALLAATDRGIASCYFGIPAAGFPRLRQEFGIPAGLAPIGVIALGYEAGYLSGRRKRSRRPAAETTSWGRFGGAAPSDPRSDRTG